MKKYIFAGDFVVFKGHKCMVADGLKINPKHPKVDDDYTVTLIPFLAEVDLGNGKGVKFATNAFNEDLIPTKEHGFIEPLNY